MYEIDDLEVLALRKKVSELELQLGQYERILKDNDLLDSPPRITDAELICVSEIAKLKILSDKGMFGADEAKILDTLVKNLLLVQGKAPIEEKKKKKQDKPDIAKLLKIASGGEDE